MKLGVKTILGLVAITFGFFASSVLEASDNEKPEANSESILVAPIEEAFTFARTRTGNVLLVTGNDGLLSVSAIDLQRETNRAFLDAVEAYRDLDENQLLDLVETSTVQKYPWQSLIAPVNEHHPHIAAGTNYRAHAKEVGLDGKPFLFPKLSHASVWNAEVLKGERLDYEAEICATPLSNYIPGQAASLGYLLCNDFTDRMALVKSLDRSLPIGRTGFAVAKGERTWLPVGPLLVIPRNSEFYQDLEIRLYVNGEIRQNASGSQMVWSPSDILKNAISNCETEYFAHSSIIKLTPCEHIPARTLILSGTPEGVIFNRTNVSDASIYLRPGDDVLTTSNFLGFLRNRVKHEHDGRGKE